MGKSSKQYGLLARDVLYNPTPMTPKNIDDAKRLAESRAVGDRNLGRNTVAIFSNFNQVGVGVVPFFTTPTQENYHDTTTPIPTSTPQPWNTI